MTGPRRKMLERLDNRSHVHWLGDMRKETLGFRPLNIFNSSESG